MKSYKSPKFNNKYASEIKEEISRILDRPSCKKMYDMMRYFLGWLDEDLKPIEAYGGKQFRSSLCLSIAEAISGDYKKALPAAASVEIFHNFTLIHDDILDNDPYRRGRKTLWNIWGIPQAINTGDAQYILSLKSLERLKEEGLSSDKILEIYSFVQEKYLIIAEGQHLDMSFEEEEISKIKLDNYLEMITKKTSVLVGIATKAGAMVVTDENEKIENAYDFGLNLGLAYQICDDMVSIWGSSEQTGKNELNDIYAKKKTLPIIYAFQHADKKISEELQSIYSAVKINEQMAKRVVEILDSLDIYVKTREMMDFYRKRAIKSLEKVGNCQIIENLTNMVNFLTPDIKKIKETA